MESAYRVFLKMGGNDLQPYVFELQTTAEMSLNPERIREYLTIVYQEQGLAMAQVIHVLCRLLNIHLRSPWTMWSWSWAAFSR